jgi:hypothetical protein
MPSALQRWLERCQSLKPCDAQHILPPMKRRCWSAPNFRKHVSTKSACAGCDRCEFASCSCEKRRCRNGFFESSVEGGETKSGLNRCAIVRPLSRAATAEVFELANARAATAWICVRQLSALIVS